MMEHMEPCPPVPQPPQPALTFALQALLARHEAYMASAERDRAELNARIEQLQLDNAALQESNERTVEENRALVDRLALLNGTVTESELKIRSLEAALQETQLTIKRLESAAGRASDMERHIATLERDQERMQNEVAHSEEEARSALYRWRMAERSLRDMQDQLERMEKEAKEERERHVEVIERMERQRAVEKDLDTAAGRLKGAAAAKNLTAGKTGGSVVSHFVRDLLQDNANLQLSMAELREMLMNSNDEIQNLREQLRYHQPVKGKGSAASTLRAELEPPEPIVAKRISQELHVHHHYHVAAAKAEQKKPKKKRHSLNPGVFTPPTALSPSTPNARRWQPNRSSPTPALLSHSARGSVTSLPPRRWSLLSDESPDITMSSVPSSPQSNHRNSMFDRGVVDLSLPASPTTSLDPTSPSWYDAQPKRSSAASIRPEFTRPIPINFDPEPNISKDIRRTSQIPFNVQSNTVPEESQEETPTPADAVSSSTDNVPDLTPTATPTTTEESLLQTSGDDVDANDYASLILASPNLDDFDPHTPQIPRSLRRVVSHESVISLSNGMDIHTLKVRPSQLTLRSIGATAAGTGISTVTASPTISRGGDGGKRGSVILRDNLGVVGLGLSAPSGRGTSRAVSGPVTRNAAKEPSQTIRSPLGRLVSWRLWGSPDPSADATRSPDPDPPKPAATLSSVSGPQSLSDARDTTSDSAGARTKLSPEPRHMARSAGINQPGAIPGFFEYWSAHQRKGAPSKVRPDLVDREALREGLEGG